MKTQLDYLKDTNLCISTATFIEVRENEKGHAIILDKTIFYPQGGGQPADIGFISFDDYSFEITFVALDANGIVWHYGSFDSKDIKMLMPGQEVTLRISQERRKEHTLIHSAGHLIGCAITELGIEIIPDKGYHFPQGPYIECSGVIDVTDALKDMLEQKVNELIKNKLAVGISYGDDKNAVDVPKGKTLRSVGFEGYDSCGCGGTHVENSADIGSIGIRKIKSKKGRTKISYTINLSST